jgi:prepilin-type N-terminal cleavage/methylation domain-containing protein
MIRGTTLVELLVVLLILGLMAGASAFAVAGFRPPAKADRAVRLDRLRAQAIRTGEPVSVSEDSGSVIRFLPDGRALGRGLDPYTGEPTYETR